MELHRPFDLVRCGAVVLIGPLPQLSLLPQAAEESLPPLGHGRQSKAPSGPPCSLSSGSCCSRGGCYGALKSPRCPRAATRSRDPLTAPFAPVDSAPRGSRPTSSYLSIWDTLEAIRGPPVASR